jgi:hypothetical protein
MMADIGSESIVFTADPAPFEAGLDRMGADLASFDRSTASREVPPAGVSVGAAPRPAYLGATAGLGRRGVLQPGEDTGQVTAGFEASMGAALRQQ